jgi:undecaprenyl-phosphate 4-deoxy-4-formamido-L-arabinose transferase
MKKYDAGVSVVVPVYNSQNTLGELARRLEYALARFDAYEIILVDDASPDASYEKIKEIALKKPHATGIALEENCGQQCAILCGLRHAKYDYSVIIDDDLEQSPEDIWALYNKILEGYDAVYGVPRYKGARSLGSLMRDALFKMMTHIPKGIKVSSFRMINRKTRDAVCRADTKFVYISMEILRHTRSIANVVISRGPKARSNYTLGKLAAVYKNIIMTYGRCFLFKRKRAKGACYKIREIVGGEK